MAVTRRFFIKSSGLAMVSLASAPSFLKRTALGQTRGGRGADSPIIIAIFQRGAVDGISMVVPFGDKSYYSYRPQIAIPEPGRNNQDGTIDLDGFFGLHPALSAFKPLYDSKNLAIVHAVGSPDNTRSHFDAQDYMESGTPGNKSVTDGWLNRFLQDDSESQSSPFRAVAISPTLPRSLMGHAPAIAMQRLSDFGIRGGAATPEIEELFAETYKGTFDAVKLLRSATSQPYTTATAARYPNSPLGQALQQIARLIKSDIGLEVAF